MAPPCSAVVETAPPAPIDVVFIGTGVSDGGAGPWLQQAYVKASNTGVGDHFGTAISLSADGKTLAVAASQEASSATGVNGNQADNSAARSGAVYIYVRSGESWVQQAYLKASNSEQNDGFGGFGAFGAFNGVSAPPALSLSADGNTLVVGAPGEDSNATGVNGNQTDNTLHDSGAAYVFVRNAGTWTQQAYVKPSTGGADAFFGGAVSLSADGNTMAVGALGFARSGAVYLFIRNTESWTQQAVVKASNFDEGDRFGWSVGLSADASTLVVGSPAEASNATGVNGSQTDNSAFASGAAYVFTLSAGTWAQQAYLKASNSGPIDAFGLVVSLSGDGNTVAISASGEGSNATGSMVTRATTRRMPPGLCMSLPAPARAGHKIPISKPPTLAQGTSLVRASV